MGDLKFYKIIVPEELWSEFKETINKNETINNILLELIKQRIEEFKKKD